MYSIQLGINNDILRKKSEKVKIFNKEIISFANILLEKMKKYDGVGLAAPQIGKNIAIIAITQWAIANKKAKIILEQIMINPSIISHSQETEIDQEGCLSLPKIQGEVERFKSIKVKYYNKYGEKEILAAYGFNARIIQHEIDHLQGILFVDKLIN